MPQLEQTYTYISQIFWLIVSFSVLYMLMRYWLIPRLLSILDARANQIASDLERASTARQDAVEVLAAYERIMSESQTRNDMRVKEGFDNQMAMIAQQSEKLQVELNQKLKEAELRINQLKEQAVADVEMAVQPLIQQMLEKSSDGLIQVNRVRLVGEIRQTVGKGEQ